MITNLILSLGVILAAIYVYFHRKFQYWGNLKVPHTRPSFPAGNMKGVGTKRSMSAVSQELYQAHPQERFMGVWTMCVPVIMIREPELVKTIFVRDFMYFHDRGVYSNEKDDPLSAHLFAINGSKWRNLRTKMTPTFTSGKMKTMFPTLVETSKQLVDVLQEPASQGEVIDVKDLSARFTTDIISSCAFGIETNSLRDPEAEFRVWSRKLFTMTLRRTVSTFVCFFAPQIAQLFKTRRIPKETTDFFLNAVKQTMDYRERTKTTRNDFIQLLIQLMKNGKLDDADDSKADGTEFTFLQAAANAFIFFIAGFETSSTTAQFALYELALNQSIQRRVREEIEEVLARHDNQMTYESLQAMQYLQQVIDETLRKYPPLPILHRECTKDYKIPGSEVTIKKGIQVQIPIYAIQHDPQYYPDPETFNPERFTDEAKASRHQYTFLPFGEGPRNCIGMRFGLMQTKVGLITLLRHFRFEIAPETEVPIRFDNKSTFFLTPAGNVNLRIRHHTS